MGLGTAFRLVPEPEVQSVAGALIRDTLDFLLAEPVERPPPAGRAARSGVDFLGDFPKQLAFLRIGKTAGVTCLVRQDRTSAAAQDELQPAAELAWLGSARELRSR